MGLLDDLTGMLSGGQPAEEGQGAASIIGNLLTQGQAGASSGVLGGLLGGLGGGASPVGGALGGAAPGGLGGMLEQLAANGLGEHVASWLSNNPNLPISAQQIQSALGSEQVQAMAARSGLPVGDWLSQLAQHLPQAANEHAGVPAG